MKIFEMRTDVTKFQSIGLADSELWGTGQFDFECLPKDDWVPPLCYTLSKVKPRGDFIYLTPGFLVFNAKTLQIMQDLFEMAGQILSLDCENEDLYGLNVLECPNALDEPNTQWRFAPGGRKTSAIEKFSFHKDRLFESSIFKIHQTIKSRIFCYSDVKDKNDEFYSRYVNSGLTGLEFNLVWETEQ